MKNNREYKRLWRLKNKEKIRQYQKEYRKVWIKTKKGKNYLERQEVIKQRFPKKLRARWLIQKRIRRGKMERKSCEVCSKEKADAHHPDYSKPAEVRWLCSAHHSEVHHLST